MCIFRAMWKSETNPEAWKTGRIVKLPDKGDLVIERCYFTPHYITTRSSARVSIKKLAETLDEYIKQEQAGFRPGRSCTDHIFTMRQILEQSKE